MPSLRPPLLVSNLINIRYLAGVELTYGMMLLTPQSKKLFVDARYTEKAEANVLDGVTVHAMDDLTKQIQRYQSIHCEADDVTLSRLQRWKKRYRGTKFLPSSGIVETMRRKKRDDEIRNIKKACSITDAILQKMPQWLSSSGGGKAPTERSIAWRIFEEAYKLGADGMAFESIVGFGSHTSRPHHTPTDRLLQKGDLVQIDMGVKVHGYCSDCSRVFFTSKPTQEQSSIFTLLQRTVATCIRRARPGVTNHTLDALARSILQKEGYEEYFTHGLGHGVGLQIHEGMSLSQRAPEMRLKEREVITIEPGIYFPKKWGMRLEETVLVEKRGVQILTKARH